MPNSDRIGKFTVTNAPTMFSYQDDIKKEIDDDPANPNPVFQASDFLAYLSWNPQGYEVTATKQTDNGLDYLQLNCVGGAWQQDQRDFNNRLQYIAVPLHHSNQTEKREVLVLKKSILDQRLTVNPNKPDLLWTLEHSRVQKTVYNSETVNDVIMYWSHERWNNHEVNGKKPNKDKYIVTCWKWLAKKDEAD